MIFARQFASLEADLHFSEDEEDDEKIQLKIDEQLLEYLNDDQSQIEIFFTITNIACGYSLINQDGIGKLFLMLLAVFNNFLSD